MPFNFISFTAVLAKLLKLVPYFVETLVGTVWLKQIVYNAPYFDIDLHLFLREKFPPPPPRLNL
jgi:hypothetical protein